MDSQNRLYLIATDQDQDPLSEFLKPILILISLVYGGMVNLMLALYKMNVLKKNKLPKPVISVGNLTVGGVGKTPLVIEIAKYIKESNRKPVILTRGYMAKDAPGQVEGSDEAHMLNQELEDVPVVVGQNRYDQAMQFLKSNDCDVFILDDGFQHWNLHRDLDIVTIDMLNPWGNNYLMPRGILREPKLSLLRADFIALTKADLAKDKINNIKREVMQLVLKPNFVETQHKPISFIDYRTNEPHPINMFADQWVCSFCSIGNPKSFELTLKSLECKIERSFPFMDHHTYVPEDIKTINNFCLDNDIKNVVTTQKDAVKLERVIDQLDPSINLYVLKIGLSIIKYEERDHLLARIDRLL